MVPLVDERDVDVAGEDACRGQAPEATTDDDDAMTRRRTHAAVTIVQASRSVRCSLTRIAFAMAVSAGFTAPMLGKKLVSTT